MKRRTTFNKIMAFLLSFIFLFTNVVSPVSASGDTYKYTGGGISGNNVAGSGTKLFNVVNTNDSSDTYQAYCIDKDVYINTVSEYEIELLENITYFTDAQAASIRGVIFGTYPNRTIAQLQNDASISTLTVKQAITATQAVIWNYSNAAQISSSNLSGNTKELFIYLSGLSQVNVPITLEAIGPTVDMSDPNFVNVTYKFKATGIDVNDIAKSYNFTTTGNPVVTTDNGYTVVTEKIAIANFNYDTNYTITLSGSKTFYDAFVFTPKQGKEDSQTLVSTGHEETVTKNEVLTFNIAEPEYTLNYVTNMSGLSYPDVTFKMGDSITAHTPTEPGYTFLGWHADAQFNNEFTAFNSMPANDVTVYGQWEAIDYTFTFDPNFGTGANVEQGFQVGGSVAGTSFTREGYTFSGWTTDEAGTTSYDDGLTNLPANDIYVYAQWEANTYSLTITYVDNLGNELNPTYTDSGLNMGNSYNVESPVIAGYTADTLVVSGSMPAGDVEYEVVYTPIDYTLSITYVDNLGNELNPAYINSGLNVGNEYNVESPVIAGYTADTLVVSGSMPADDVEYEVVYTPIDYTLSITYVDNLGNELNPAYINSGLNVGNEYNVESPVIAGYTADTLVVFGSMPAGDVEYEVVYTPIDYTFTFDPNHGEEANVIEEFQVYGSVSEAIFTREGYTFSGWTTDMSGETEYAGGFVELPAQNIYVYAQWEAIDYTLSITYVDNLGNELNPAYINSGLNVGNEYNVESPIIAGYTADTLVVSGSMPAGDVEFEVVYTPIDYTFTFDPNHGEEANVVQGFQVGGSVEGTTFTREGYTFSGWTTDMGGETEYIGGLDELPARDLYVYAQWVANDYTFTFDPNFGTGANVEQIFQVGGEVDGTTFVREGFSFTGWTTDEAGENVYLGGLSDLPANDIYVYAQWEEVLPEEYVLTYITNQPGLVIDNVTFIEGDSIVAPNPTAEGFVFLGWFVDEALSEEFTLFNNMPARDVVVHADWGEVLGDEDGYEITFITNQPSLTIENINYVEGEAIAQPKPTVEGFTFLGWYADKELTVKFDKFSAMPGENVIVYADWGEVLGEEDKIVDTSDDSRNTGLGLLFFTLGILALVITRKEEKEVS